MIKSANLFISGLLKPAHLVTVLMEHRPGRHTEFSLRSFRYGVFVRDNRRETGACMSQLVFDFRPPRRSKPFELQRFIQRFKIVCR